MGEKTKMRNYCGISDKGENWTSAIPPQYPRNGFLVRSCTRHKNGDFREPRNRWKNPAMAPQWPRNGFLTV